MQNVSPMLSFPSQPNSECSNKGISVTTQQHHSFLLRRFSKARARNVVTTTNFLTEYKGGGDLVGDKEIKKKQCEGKTLSGRYYSFVLGGRREKRFPIIALLAPSSPLPRLHESLFSPALS